VNARVNAVKKMTLLPPSTGRSSVVFRFRRIEKVLMHPGNRLDLLDVEAEIGGGIAGEQGKLETNAFFVRPMRSVGV
jgi:hypothetical protein